MAWEGKSFITATVTRMSGPTKSTLPSSMQNSDGTPPCCPIRLSPSRTENAGKRGQRGNKTIKGLDGPSVAVHLAVGVADDDCLFSYGVTAYLSGLARNILRWSVVEEGKVVAGRTAVALDAHHEFAGHRYALHFRRRYIDLAVWHVLRVVPVTVVGIVTR